MPGQIQVCDDYESLSQSAAELLVKHAQVACASKGQFSVALSGGGTPRRTYELLAAEPYRTGVDWSRVHVFWGDERCVPRDDDRSNAKMTMRAWLEHVPIPRQHIHAINGTGDPLASAEDYEQTLREFFQDESTTFDLALLGLGENGHTASLFPDSTLLAETQRWVAPTFVAQQDLYRITLTLPPNSRRCTPRRQWLRSAK